MGDTLTDKDLICFGIIKALGRFECHHKRGSRAWATSRNPEPLRFLLATWGGRMPWRKGGVATWEITSKDKVQPLWLSYRRWANENQKAWVPEKWHEAERRQIEKLYGTNE